MSKKNCEQSMLLFVLLVLLGVQWSQQAATTVVEAETYYVAGVVEYQPSSSMVDNLANYIDIIESSNASTADIIVFPEATLNTVNTAVDVTAPEELTVPCLTDASNGLMSQLSCAARKVSKYIVINVSERQLCSVTPEDLRPCASNGYNVFNTNVVFDRSGTVVSRYRKIHLFGEPRNTTMVPELSYFTTDFNVTFGHFVCFDMLFYSPAQEMHDRWGIRDFVYPTMWFSQLPFLTAVQTQLGWSYANDVNLLAAGSSLPRVGSTGTGIYHGRQGTLVSVMNRVTPERRIYVAQVPKFSTTPAVMTTRYQKEKKVRERSIVAVPATAAASDDISLKRDFLEYYTSEIVNLTSTSANIRRQLCQDDFCCNFDVAWQSLNDLSQSDSIYTFRIAVYNGDRYDEADGVDPNYVRNCAIYTCTGTSVNDCGRLLTEGPTVKVIFTRLVIEVQYPKSRELLLMPNTLDDNLMPLEPSQFSYIQTESSDGHYTNIQFSLDTSGGLMSTQLLTFALYGNYYDDVETYRGGGAALLHFSFATWLALLITLSICR